MYKIVTGRRRLDMEQIATVVPIPDTDFKSDSTHPGAGNGRNLTTGITPGKGWELWGENSGICDGSYTAACKRQGYCVLQGQQAARGAIIGNEYSGWLVVTLKDLKEGIIILKLHTWQTPEESTMTRDWTTVNNERSLRESLLRGIEGNSVSSMTNGIREGNRSLAVRSTDIPTLPDTMTFEYAVDGNITTLARDEFVQAVKQLQRVLQVLTVLDDPNFTSEPKDVELAIRMTGCGRQCTFGLSHIYWA